MPVEVGRVPDADGVPAPHSPRERPRGTSFELGISLALPSNRARHVVEPANQPGGPVKNLQDSRRSTHRILIATAAVVCLLGGALAPKVFACDTFAGCWEGCFCEQHGVGGVCGYSTTLNACVCAIGTEHIQTNDCSVSGG
jgi:hypothetical protein